jgi:murein DD-endopeptidase MepM/ murein hydrolase activator NlpD
MPTATFRICSPLQVVARIDLPRVISEPYKPPPMGSDARHQGVDFAYYHWRGNGRIEGSQVRAVLSGRVAASLANTYPFGDIVIIETDNQSLPVGLKEALGIPPGKSLYVLYAHMQEDSIKVGLGENALSCQTIGAIGKSGNTLAAHLHLETRYGPPGISFTSFTAFTKSTTKESRDSYRLWRISGQFQHFDPMRLLLYGLAGVLPPTATAEPPGSD